MGLSISTSNVLINQTPTITDAGVGESANNISDPDHSLNYTCGSSASNFAVSYGARSNISYVGISGHNAATPASATIQLYNGALLVDSVTIKRNHNIMFTFPSMDFTDLKVVFVTSPVSYQMTVSFIAAGKHLTIASGEQAGYKRAWLSRSITQRMTTNLRGAPVAGTKKSISPVVTLSLPNQMAAFSQDEWQDFEDFSYEQPFFIKEVEGLPESTAMAFNPKHDIKAHSSTRSLNVIMVKFTAYTGL